MRDIIKVKSLVFIISFLLIASTACDKIFLDVEGENAMFQGKWQLKTMSSGNTQQKVDTVYFNFQNNIFSYQIYTKKDSLLEIFGYYTFQDQDSIYLELFTNSALLDNKPIQNVDFNFIDWHTIGSDGMGQDTLAKMFKIDQIKRKQLNLSTTDDKYFFEKF
ncbi:hypothetical protein AwDysgo_05350 [Bacteroidales bacterium]|nr:hypothetical protein AwDysgo_05350 [Bacteroidales bacterium]